MEFQPEFDVHERHSQPRPDTHGRAIMHMLKQQQQQQQYQQAPHEYEGFGD